jgi:hypothetical protein
MKQHTIVIEIGKDGVISADADGFTGGACLAELERLLEGLGGTGEVRRKEEPRVGRVVKKNTQRSGRKS